MSDREQREPRVAALERRLSQVAGARGVRWRSDAALLGLPLLAVAVGPDVARGEMRGHARGVVAVGDIASGVLAVGGLARGLIAVGGLALGGVSLGGLSLGLFLAFGGAAIGGVALGGGALGGAAVGGAAAGYYACGGGVAGHAVVGPVRRDAEAAAFFRQHVPARLCPAAAFPPTP
jgi:hypothetical protein